MVSSHYSRILLGIVLCCIAFLHEMHAAKVVQDLTLTSSQNKALQQFKKIVLPRLTKEYQKSDIYLVRWLRAKKFNIPQAESLLQQDMKWRAREEMDDIRKEDWSDMEADYPYFIDGFDKEGKPIITADFDEWDIRRGVLAGKRDRIIRYMTKSMDDAVDMIRGLQAQKQNVTQYDFIINMNSFNLMQHGCLQCLPIYLAFVSNYENHYPGAADKIIFMNTPVTFEVVLNLVRPVFSDQTKEALKVYGNNKAEWESILFQDIDRDQLPSTYGGTKVRT